MPAAGLGEPTLAMLRAAIADPDGEVVARYRAKLRRVAGSACLWWSGAVSARGHGRFWLGRVEGRDVVMIAHRFGYALAHGVEALQRASVLGHRCDNPLCQQIGPGHVVASSNARNRQEWAMRRHTIGNPLRDMRGPRGRARALRDAVRDGEAMAFHVCARAGLVFDDAQLPLWFDPLAAPGA